MNFGARPVVSEGLAVIRESRTAADGDRSPLVIQRMTAEGGVNAAEVVALEVREVEVL